MKRLTALILALSMVLLCAVPTGSASGLWNFLEELGEHMLSDTTWAMYIYMCGSDLESGHGCATADLEQILSVNFGENIKVVVQTGGAASWEMSGISSTSVDRYVVENNGMRRVESLGNVSMGDANTLSGFLKFCRSEYPADREILVFWDHGGGVTGGVCYDEMHNYDCLTIPEIKQAMAASMAPNAAEPPLEFVCFYTCLTANIDMAAAMSGYTRYMIASEESSLAGFLRFREILQTLVINPGIESVNLGKFICETSALYLSLYYTSVTVSMLQMDKLPALLDAYEQFGREAQQLAAQQGDNFYIALSRAAHDCERYGRVGGGTGSFEMTDLGDLMTKSRGMLKSAQQVLDALDACVIYNKTGKSKQNSHGIACYYPYSGDNRMFPDYAAGAAGQSVPEFYRQMLRSGSVFEDLGGDDPGMDGFLSQLFEQPEVYLQGDELHIRIPRSMRYLLTGLDIQVYGIDSREHQIYGYGRTHSITGDWDTGEFTAILTDQWGSLDGHLCYMEPMEESREVSTYQVPVLLNGSLHQLVVEYDYAAGSYEIRGAFEVRDGAAAPNSYLTALKAGDQITTLLVARDYDHSNGRYVKNETFTWGSGSAFRDMALPDGYYYVPFIVSDFLNRQIMASYAVLELKGGEITAVNRELGSF